MDSFVLYRSVFDALMAVDADTCKDLLQYIGEYAMDEKVPEQPGTAFALFLAIRPLLDARRKKAEAGRLGGLKRKSDSEELPEEIRQARKTYPYKQWRKAVMERDGHTCTQCGATDELEAHHIKPFAEFPDLWYDVSNGVTLCHKCHALLHFASKSDKQTEANGSKTEADVSKAKQTEAKEERRKKKEENNNIKDIMSDSEYPYKEIVDYLNEKAGKRFLDKSKDTRQHIRARFSEGRTKEDFFLVIDNMSAAWKGDPKMDAFLRPSTLFGSSQKFENYMNQTPQKKKPQNRFNNFHQREYDYDEMERRLL